MSRRVGGRPVYGWSTQQQGGFRNGVASDLRTAIPKTVEEAITAGGWIVRVRCQCGYHRNFLPEAFPLGAADGDKGLGQLKLRLKCTSCGGRGFAKASFKRRPA